MLPEALDFFLFAKQHMRRSILLGYLCDGCKCGVGFCFKQSRMSDECDSFQRTERISHADEFSSVGRTDQTIVLNVTAQKETMDWAFSEKVNYLLHMLFRQHVGRNPAGPKSFAKHRGFCLCRICSRKHSYTLSLHDADSWLTDKPPALTIS